MKSFKIALAQFSPHIGNLEANAQKMLERCACAIGEDIVSRQMLLNHDSTLVMLSPVAGG